MNNILEQIVAYKAKEIQERQSLYPVALLEKSKHFTAKPLSLSAYLTRPDKHGVIAEIKRRSPSLGPINPYLSVEQVSIGYMQGGASALSILTDSPSFGGSNKDLTEARRFNLCPILRKEFILEEYQVLEARSIGADAILLIAAILTPQKAQQLASLAKSLGMEVLLEIHSESELGHWHPDMTAIGVNNRDLTTFQVDVRTSYQLLEKLPTDAVRISESGLRDALTVAELKRAGYNGFLIGELFLKQPNPAEACAKFTRQLNALFPVVNNQIGNTPKSEKHV